MDIENLYSHLNSESTPDAKRQELISYLKKNCKDLPENVEERRSVAYEIAGLMSTTYAHSLSTSDALDTILTLAGELETPDKESATKWAELRSLVATL
jgi:hypothetical protein